MNIRKEFLNYFKNKDHLILPSSSLIPDNDPTVLLTTAGMQQFKPYYLGIEKPPYPRIATVQKCFRTSDIDKIGDSDKHLTFFEMLGNFAFADYFKKEAIELAIDFILNILKIDENRLLFTVFEGYKDLQKDEDSENYLIQCGISPDRIYMSGFENNFWGPAGDTGPCGPCTEIYYDFGEKYSCKKPNCGPNCECGRYIEIWNLVFTQYNFDGIKYNDLPNKNIDTGMGLERIYAAVDNINSVFKIQLFERILKKIYEISGQKLIDDGLDKNSHEINKAIKVIADHSRAIYFLTSDGVLPSNEGRGYILRRIIRRAVRFGKRLGIEGNFLNEIGKVIIEDYKDIYPELENKKEKSFQIVKDEEIKFSNTLKEGMKVLLQCINDLKERNERFLNPRDAFKLYDTFGFPIELTEEILAENNLSLDKEKFNEYMKTHIEISKQKTSFNKKISEYLDIDKNIATEAKTEFMGYEVSELTAKIKKIVLEEDKGKKIITDCLNENQRGEIILDRTPFYGEKGGEIGDRGIIKTLSGGIFEVEDVQIPVDGVIIHKGVARKGSFSLNSEVIAKIDTNFRKNVSKNHTATHLLHWALRNIYGEEVEQAGSFVSDRKLRFDYKFFGEYDENSNEKIENLINKKIMDNDLVKTFETTIEYAKEIGAIALFGEKYGKFVRVVEIGNYSRELCGGIHVKRTGEIGLFKIISNSSIGSNLRRIEAYTGFMAINYLNEKENIIKELTAKLRTEEKDIIKKIDELKTEVENYKEKINLLILKQAKDEIIKRFSLESTNINDGYKLISFDFSNSRDYEILDAKLMGILSDELKDYYKNNLFLVISNSINSKPFIVYGCTKDLVAKGIDCSKIAKEAGKIINGGGGGRLDYAQSGGLNKNLLPKALDFAINKAKEILNQNLK
jgi:alanyl-tRNA synthetase